MDIAASTVINRIAQLDWPALEDHLHTHGFAATGALLTPAECQTLSSLYPEREVFRSRVVMARHGFGQGEYKYFAYPLPELVQSLREALYPRLAPVANRWHQAMGLDVTFPDSLEAMLERCHAAGQARPTPLLLKYGPTDYNCMHQDLYGGHVFPIQATFLLSSPAAFVGGEFVMVEQRPRMQSRPRVVPLVQGEAVLFAVHQRPVQGTRGAYRVNMRHGVSEVLSGERFTMGVIFHDAA
ncbi:MAG: 2OG-Fe(II) oxygenase [Burkholderiales bacterium]